MTFTEAVKRLAEREPEKFWIRGNLDGYTAFGIQRFRKPDFIQWSGDKIYGASQDLIDEILALVGYAFRFIAKVILIASAASFWFMMALVVAKKLE